jgi:hypothetical protein
MMGSKTAHNVEYTNMLEHLPTTYDSYGNEHEVVLDRIITGDKTWIHNSEPDSKQQSREWKHPQSPSKKELKGQPSAGN